MAWILKRDLLGRCGRTRCDLLEYMVQQFRRFDEVYPALDTIAVATGASRSVVQTFIERLKDLGWLVVGKRGSVGGRFPHNQYFASGALADYIRQCDATAANRATASAKRARDLAVKLAREYGGNREYEARKAGFKAGCASVREAILGRISRKNDAKKPVKSEAYSVSTEKAPLPNFGTDSVTNPIRKKDTVLTKYRPAFLIEWDARQALLNGEKSGKRSE